MKKADIIIIGTVALCFLLSIIMLVSFSKQGSRVIIKQDNKIVYNQSIKTDNKIELETNVITIKDGMVFVSDANCKNQVCVKKGKISKKGESIVCLPNKVIVEIK